jgi:recombination protein RecR
MNQYPSELLSLIALLKKLPGVGTKTAERFAFTLLDWSSNDLANFSVRLSKIQQEIQPCSTCGCLKSAAACLFCDPHKRDHATVCIVSSPRDVYAIEETRAFRGTYQVIGGMLSPLEGKSISAEALSRLMNRLDNHPIQEVIIALDSTLEGDATALFLKKQLEARGVPTTRLAFGLPMGSSLDYVDYGTLERAFTGRRAF